MNDLYIKENALLNIKHPDIIVDIPGIGFVGSIVGEYLIEHLDSELIEYAWMNVDKISLPVHNSCLVYPISSHYIKKHNIIIVHIIADPHENYQELMTYIEKLYFKTEAKNVFLLDGIIDNSSINRKIFYYTKQKNNNFEKLGALEFKNGIILGFGAHLILNKHINSNLIYSTTQIQSSDAFSSIELLNFVDNYFKLNVDKQELIRKARNFETKLKDISSKSKLSNIEKDKKKNFTYIG